MSSRSFAEHEDHRLDFVIRDSGFKPKAGKILRDLTQSSWGRCLCNDGCKWLYFLVLSDPANWPLFFSNNPCSRIHVKTHPPTGRKRADRPPLPLPISQVWRMVGSEEPSVDWAIDVPVTFAARQKSRISNWHNNCASLVNPKTLKWSDYRAYIALIVASQWNTLTWFTVLPGRYP